MNPFHIFTFFTSFGFIFMSVIAYYYGFYWWAALDLGLFLTSVNYWRNPLHDWRRNVDMFVVWLVISLHFFDTPWTEELVTLAILIVGLYGYNKIIGGNNLLKSIRHSTMHICAVVFYSKIYENIFNF